MMAFLKVSMLVWVTVGGSRTSKVSKSANLVLLPVHSSQRANVHKNVLRCVCELESIDIAKAELSINDELRKTQDFSTQVGKCRESKTSYAQVRMARDVQVGLTFFSLCDQPPCALAHFALSRRIIDHRSSTMKHEGKQPC